MPQTKTLIVLGLILSLFWVGCAKPPTVTRGGVEISVEDAARLDFQAAERLLQQRKYSAAAREYQKIFVHFPTSSYADNSLFRLAQIHRIRKNNSQAITLLERFFKTYPNSEVRGQAHEELAIIFFRSKQYEKSLRHFIDLDWESLSLKKRGNLQKAARVSFKKVQKPRMKLLWLTRLYDSESNKKTRQELAHETMVLLDSISDTAFLERVIEQRRERFPAGYIHFKLAKLSEQQGDPRQARRWITRFLNRFRGHELSRDAVILSEKFQRREEVNPQAVGVLLPLSGKNRLFGRQILEGLALAIDVFSKESSKTHAIRFFIEDSGDTPESALNALMRLIEEHQVIAVIGPLSADQSQVTAQAAAGYQLPIISLSATEGITQVSENVFRNNLTKSEQATRLAQVATSFLGIKRCAILFPKSNYGKEFMRLFWEAFEANGGEIRGAEEYKIDATDFGLPLKRLVGLYPISMRKDEVCSKEEKLTREDCFLASELPPKVDFEALFVPDGFERATQVAPALAYYDIRGVQLLGTNLWNTTNIFTGGAGTHLEGAIFLDGFFKNRNDPVIANFVSRFYATYGDEPGIFQATSFDTASLVLHVLRDYDPSSRESFQRALKRQREFPGVTGTLSVSENREITRNLTVLMIDQRHIVELVDETTNQAKH